MNAVQALETLCAAHPDALRAKTPLGDLPYEVAHTVDRGLAPLPCGQLDFPLLWDAVFSELPAGTPLLETGRLKIRTVSSGCGIYVVRVPSTISELQKQYKRFYRSAASLEFAEHQGEELRDLLLSNRKRWEARGEESADVEATLQRLSQRWDQREVVLAFSRSPNSVFQRGPLCAVIELQTSMGVTHWVNTFISADADNSGVGNACLLYAMTEKLGCDFSLGIDIFEYKKLWKPRHMFVPGLEFA